MDTPPARPILIAHRGASAYLPEHTLPAVTAAHALGADYIEQDVVLSADGVPVVLHDIYLDATTDVATVFPERVRDDGRYYALDFTLTELKRLEVTERVDGSGKNVFPQRFPHCSLGLRIPTLEEEIQLIEGLNKSRNRHAGYYLEFKAPRFHNNAGYDIAKIVLDTLDKHQLTTATARVYLQCFDPETLRYLKRLQSPLPLIQLIADNDWQETPGVDYDAMRSVEGLAIVAAYADGIGPWIPQLFSPDYLTTSPLVATARDLGLQVHPYTLRADALQLGAPDFTTLQRRVLLEAQVDGVFTDFVDLTRMFIDTHFSATGEQ